VSFRRIVDAGAAADVIDRHGLRLHRQGGSFLGSGAVIVMDETRAW
jgi:hypothetical protein